MEEPSRHYDFEGFRLDTLRRELRDPAGDLLPLTSKAFDVLCVLIENRAAVVGKEALLVAVWPGRVVEENNLTQAIAALRRAFGVNAHDRRFIVTVPGRGYRFVADLEGVAEDVPSAPERRVATPDPAPDPVPDRGAIPLPATDTLPPTTAMARERGRRPRMAGALLLVAMIGLGGWLWQRPPRADASAGQVPAAMAGSIAVLPLANASRDPEQQFFADGLSENLINALSNYEGLKVIGRSSSFRFRDSHEDGRRIGAKLGVAYLLAGSVQRVDDRVRVSVELVNAADGLTLWTQRFDRPYRNLFALQDDIALSVAGALQGKLPHIHGMVGAMETARPASGNLEAYSAFLRGSYSILRDNRKAIEQFAEATRLDPDYAQAWQWLGFVRAINARSWTDAETLHADCARARREIETAIRLDPDSGLGYSALAVQMTSCDYDWNGALAQYRKAMPLVSDASPAHGQYSRLLATLGRVNQAIGERRRYLDSDPLTLDGNYWQFLMEASLGRLDDAAASLGRVLELEAPEEVPWYAGNLSYLALLRGDAATALARAREVPPGLVRDRALALALQAGNDRAEADAALQRLIRTDGDSRFGSYHIARTYALRGDADGMFLWLDRDWQRRGMAAYQILFDPLLLRFRDDPRFAAFCAKTGLPPPTESEALSIDQIRAASRGRG